MIGNSLGLANTARILFEQTNVLQTMAIVVGLAGSVALGDLLGKSVGEFVEHRKVWTPELAERWIGKLVLSGLRIGILIGAAAWLYLK